jgi:hypothetical protein
VARRTLPEENLLEELKIGSIDGSAEHGADRQVLASNYPFQLCRFSILPHVVLLNTPSQATPPNLLLSLGSLSLIPARRHILTFSRPTPIRGHTSILTSCVIPPPTSSYVPPPVPFRDTAVYYFCSLSPTTRRSEESTLRKFPLSLSPCAFLSVRPSHATVTPFEPPFHPTSGKGSAFQIASARPLLGLLGPLHTINPRCLLAYRTHLPHPLFPSSVKPRRPVKSLARFPEVCIAH